MFSNLSEYAEVYGPFKCFIIWIFGSSSVWHTQLRVLIQTTSDEAAREYAKSIQLECNMTGIAGPIVAQIAMTAIALEFLSQTHWMARALWAFSVVSGTMAVFYARALQCIMARLLCCPQVRVWIRGCPDTTENRKREEAIAKLLSKARCSGPLSKDEIVEKVVDGGDCFKLYCPAITSVIAMSVPSMLLASSLISLLLGFGVYLGFLWRRDLDTAGGFNDSRNVFIFYVVAVVLCFAVYLFPLVVDDQHRHYGQSYPCLKEHPMYCLLNGKKGSDEESPECSQGIEQRPSCSKGHENLIAALNDAAKARRESAIADEHVAKLYEQYAQKFGDENTQQPQLKTRGAAVCVF